MSDLDLSAGTTAATETGPVPREPTARGESSGTGGVAGGQGASRPSTGNGEGSSSGVVQGSSSGGTRRFVINPGEGGPIQLRPGDWVHERVEGEWVSRQIPPE